MILVIAGTKDGRELAERLSEKGYAVIASTVSEYGASLYKDSKIKVNDKPLPKEELTRFISENKVTLIIDATHPYAAQISKTAMALAAEKNLYYLRYERAASDLPDYDKLYLAADYKQAAEQAARLGKNIFLTTGSRQLHLLANNPALKDCTLTARVLPDSAVIAECSRLGFSPRNIIAMQGPFSHELNRELYLKYKADVVVSKNSGNIGGTDTKITAAIELNLPLVIIDRPRLDYTNMADTYEKVEEFAAKCEKDLEDR
jgi:precorrin-6A/cobalt-precorrin-6A reductase